MPKLQSDGRVRIPKDIRQEVGLRKGDHLEITIVNDSLRIDVPTATAMTDDAPIWSELAALGWGGLKHSDLPLIRILGWACLLIILFVMGALAALPVDRMDNLLMLLVAVEAMRITILQHKPPLKIHYNATTRFDTWLGRRLSQPEISCSSSSIAIAFGYFILRSLEVAHSLGMVAFALTIAGIAIGMKRQNISQYLETLQRRNWEWRLYDRNATAPTCRSFAISLISHLVLGAFGLVLWFLLSDGSADALDGMGWVVWVVVVVATYKFVLQLSVRKTNPACGTKRLISVRRRADLWPLASAVRVASNVAPIGAAYYSIALIVQPTSVTQDDAMSILLPVSLLLYGISSLVPIIHPGGRTISDIIAGTAPASSES